MIKKLSDRRAAAQRSILAGTGRESVSTDRLFQFLTTGPMEVKTAHEVEGIVDWMDPNQDAQCFHDWIMGAAIGWVSEPVTRDHWSRFPGIKLDEIDWHALSDKLRHHFGWPLLRAQPEPKGDQKPGGDEREAAGRSPATKNPDGLVRAQTPTSPTQCGPRVAIAPSGNIYDCNLDHAHWFQANVGEEDPQGWVRLNAMADVCLSFNQAPTAAQWEAMSRLVLAAEGSREFFVEDLSGSWKMDRTATVEEFRRSGQRLAQFCQSVKYSDLGKTASAEPPAPEPEGEDEPELTMEQKVQALLYEIAQDSNRSGYIPDTEDLTREVTNFIADESGVDAEQIDTKWVAELLGKLEFPGWRAHPLPSEPLPPGIKLNFLRDRWRARTAYWRQHLESDIEEFKRLEDQARDIEGTVREMRQEDEGVLDQGSEKNAGRERQRPVLLSARRKKRMNVRSEMPENGDCPEVAAISATAAMIDPKKFNQEAGRLISFIANELRENGPSDSARLSNLAHKSSKWPYDDNFSRVYTYALEYLEKKGEIKFDDQTNSWTIAPVAQAKCQCRGLYCMHLSAEEGEGCNNPQSGGSFCDSCARIIKHKEGYETQRVEHERCSNCLKYFPATQMAGGTCRSCRPAFVNQDGAECEGCGRSDLPLHTDGRCPGCSKNAPIDNAPETPADVPVMNQADRQKRIDVLLDRWQSEPAARPQIEQQLRSLRAVRALFMLRRSVKDELWAPDPEIAKNTWRRYQCSVCGNVQAETTNHLGAIMSYCKKCSWAPSKGECYNPMGDGRCYRKFTYMGEIDERHQSKDDSVWWDTNGEAWNRRGDAHDPKKKERVIQKRTPVQVLAEAGFADPQVLISDLWTAFTKSGARERHDHAITSVHLTGSRWKGDAKEGSDLDVVVYHSGNALMSEANQAFRDRVKEITGGVVDAFLLPQSEAWDHPMSGNIMALTASGIPKFFRAGERQSPQSYPDWNQEKAAQFLAVLQPLLAQIGVQAQIVGSVSADGESNHDLDLRLTPSGAPMTTEQLIAGIEGQVGPQIAHMVYEPLPYKGKLWFMTITLKDKRVIDLFWSEKDFKIETGAEKNTGGERQSLLSSWNRRRAEKNPDGSVNWDTVAAIAEQARVIMIETNPDADYRPLSMCGVANEALAQELLKLGHKVDEVRGVFLMEMPGYGGGYDEVGPESFEAEHTWLEVDGQIVDISADQFNEYLHGGPYPPVFIGTNDGRFVERSRRPATRWKMDDLQGSVLSRWRERRATEQITDGACPMCNSTTWRNVDDNPAPEDSPHGIEIHEVCPECGYYHHLDAQGDREGFNSLQVVNEIRAQTLKLPPLTKLRARPQSHERAELVEEQKLTRMQKLLKRTRPDDPPKTAASTGFDMAKLKAICEQLRGQCVIEPGAKPAGQCEGLSEDLSEVLANLGFEVYVVDGYVQVDKEKETFSDGVSGDAGHVWNEVMDPSGTIWGIDLSADQFNQFVDGVVYPEVLIADVNDPIWSKHHEEDRRQITKTASIRAKWLARRAAAETQIGTIDYRGRFVPVVVQTVDLAQWLKLRVDDRIVHDPALGKQFTDLVARIYDYAAAKIEPNANIRESQNISLYPDIERCLDYYGYGNDEAAQGIQPQREQMDARLREAAFTMFEQHRIDLMGPQQAADLLMNMAVVLHKDLGMTMDEAKAKLGTLLMEFGGTDPGDVRLNSLRGRWTLRRASEQKLLRELVCTAIGSDSGTENEAVLPKGAVVGVQPHSNDHTIFFYSPIYSKIIVRGRVMKTNQYSAPVQEFRAATDIGYGEGKGYEHESDCFCDECMAKDDLTTRRCPSCGSRECPGDGDSIDCRKPGSMTIKDVPVETRDSLLDKFNRGEIDEKTLRRRMKQIGSTLLSRWHRRANSQEALIQQVLGQINEDEIAGSGIAAKVTDFVWSLTRINPKDTNFGKDDIAVTKQWLDEESADYLADMGEPRLKGGARAQRREIEANPVIVIKGDDGVLWVMDGNHRTAQAMVLGLDSIPALVGVKKPGVGRTPINPDYKMGSLFERWVMRQANDPLKKIIEINGVKVGIEWPKGSTRTWKHLPGNDYEKLMKADYGYIRQTEGEDGEEIDVYAGPKRDSDLAFVVTQLDKKTGEYDEDKIMLGYGSEAEAKASYLEHMEKAHFGGIKKLSWDEFLKLVPKSQRAKEKTAAMVDDPGSQMVLTDDLRVWDRQSKGQGDKVTSMVLPKGTTVKITKKMRLQHGGSPELLEIVFWPPKGKAGAGLPTRGSGVVRADDLRFVVSGGVVGQIPEQSIPSNPKMIENHIVDLLRKGPSTISRDLHELLDGATVSVDENGEVSSWDAPFADMVTEVIGKMLDRGVIRFDGGTAEFSLLQEPEPTAVEHVPEMSQGDVQTKIDALLDQLAAEPDPNKKKQIEQRIRSLSATTKDIWRRRAGDTTAIPEQRSPGAVAECDHGWPGKKPGERGWCGRCRL